MVQPSLTPLLIAVATVASVLISANPTWASPASTSAPTANNDDDPGNPILAGGLGSAIGLIVSIVVGVPLFLYQSTGGLYFYLVPRLPKDLTTHFFIAHNQDESGDRMLMVYNVLKYYVGAKVSYEMNMRALEETDMQARVEHSGVFVIFLTKNIFQEKNVIRGLELAFKQDKPIILILDVVDPEKDTNPDRQFEFSDYEVWEGAGFETEQRLTILLREVEAIPLRRRNFELQAMVKQMMIRFRQRKEYMVKLEDGMNIKKELKKKRKVKVQEAKAEEKLIKQAEREEKAEQKLMKTVEP